MANKRWYESFLLVCGGILLVLGAVRGGIHTFGYFGTHNVMAVPPGTLGAGPSFIAGMVVGNLFLFAVGVGLLWLAWTKRAHHVLSEPAA